MSYSFDGSNDNMIGTFTGTYADPLTIACWIKLTAHPSQADHYVSLGNANNSLSSSYRIGSGATPNAYNATTVDSGGAADSASEDFNIDAATIGTTYNATTGWAALVGKFVGDTDRTIYVAALANSDNNVQSSIAGDAVQHIRFMESFTGTGDAVGLLAEVAVWDVALSDADITAFMSGTKATSIDPTNLIGYWPLSTDNATQNNEGLDAGGDMAVTAATFSSDHPTITVPGASAKKRRQGLMGVG